MPTISGIVVATGTQAAGRRTLLDVESEMARTLNGADETILATAGDAFRAAVRTMNRKGMWPWEILDEDLVMTPNSPFTTLNSAVKKPLSMHYTDTAGGTPNRPITYCAYDRFVEAYSLAVTEQPSVYTIPNLFETGQIRWAGIPPAAYSVRFNYYRVTPAPMVPDEVIEIPDYVIEVYMGFAWLEFCKRLSSRQRPMPIEVALQQANTAFRELSAHVNAPGDRSRSMGPYGYWY
jgi:hypothetical protein